MARFTAGDWRIVIEAVFTLLATSVVVHTTTASDFGSGVATPVSATSTPPGNDIQRVAWLTDVTGRRLFRMRCLTRSLAIARMLRRRGVAADVRVGVRTEHGQLVAHAWAEWNGQPLNDTVRHLQTFAAFDQPVSRWRES